jgi:hypothetical protein
LLGHIGDFTVFLVIPILCSTLCLFDGSDFILKVSCLCIRFLLSICPRTRNRTNDGVRDPSPIKKSTSASPITTQAFTAAASSSASTPSQSSTVVVAKGTRGSAFGARAAPTGTSGANGGAESHSSESSHGAPRSSRATRKEISHSTQF